MPRILASLAVVFTLASVAAAASKTYSFEDPKNVNSIGIFLDSRLEPIRGVAHGVTGDIHYDSADPAGFTGEIAVDPTRIQMANPKMTEALQGQKWLNVQAFNTITFKFTGARVVEQHENVTKLEVQGVFTALGLEVNKTVTLTATLIPDGVKQRNMQGSGDLLILRGAFTVTRKELGLQLGTGNDHVADTIQLDVAIAGFEKVENTEKTE